MQAKNSLFETGGKSSLRQAILRRAPGISSDQLDFICESINTNRRYFIKTTSNIQKYLNLVTREMIVSEETRIFSEVIPLCGNFQCPYFEKVGENRLMKSGNLDSSLPAAAVKIRIGTENLRSTVTYSLILFLTE